MTKFKIFLTITAAVLSSTYALAQIQSTTVQVENDYAGKSWDYNKNDIEMFVPDSLYNFEYKFDYSVFDSPYKGAYEFSPYAVKMTPQTSFQRPGKLFLKAGAGYSFHPEVDFAYTPLSNEKFALNIFANCDGYYGKMYGVGSDFNTPEYYEVTGNLKESLGVSGRSISRNSTFLFEIGHDGVFAGGGSYLSAYAGFRLKSNVDSELFFYYDLDAKCRVGFDHQPGLANMRNQDFVLKGTIGPVLKKKYRLLVDFDIEDEILSAPLDINRLLFCAEPHLEFSLGPVNLSAGVHLGYMDKFCFAPDVHATLGLVDTKLELYADLSGGDMFNSWYDLKMFDPFFNLNSGTPFLSEEDYNLQAGFRGRFGTSFSYDVNAGYGKYDKMLTEGLLDEKVVILPADMTLLHADVRMAWLSDKADVNFSASYRKGKYEEGFKGFELPAVSAELDVVYNWSKRLFLGLHVSGETGRNGCRRMSLDNGTETAEYGTLPAWIDLGVSAEYKFNSRWGFWAKGGNLLGNTVRRNPLHSWKGQYITAGICLSL